MDCFSDVRAFLKENLGAEAVKSFDMNLEDVLYGIRSWALVDTKSPLDNIRTRIKKMAVGLLMESVKSYLEKHFEKNWVVTNDELFDGKMHKIEAVENIKKKQAVIVRFLEDTLFEEFVTGRDLAADVITRAQMYIREHREPTKQWDYSAEPKKKNRDYKQYPPIEQLEIEILELEKKLPALSILEGDRLRELYEKCAGKS